MSRIYATDAPTGRGLHNIRPLPMSDEDERFWRLFHARKAWALSDVRANRA